MVLFFLRVSVVLFLFFFVFFVSLYGRMHCEVFGKETSRLECEEGDAQLLLCSPMRHHPPPSRVQGISVFLKINTTSQASILL